jgi:hypothetical protein
MKSVTYPLDEYTRLAIAALYGYNPHGNLSIIRTTGRRAAGASESRRTCGIVVPKLGFVFPTHSMSADGSLIEYRARRRGIIRRDGYSTGRLR